MRKLIVMFAVVAVLAPASVFASIYGVLSGKVVDTDGKGVVGATVLVEGTTRGTNVRAKDGSFTVSNITAGSYTVRVRSVGKQEQKINVRISADQTTNINVTLKEDAVMMDSVVVTAESISAKKVDETNVGSISTMSNEEITKYTSSNLASVVGMSAGVASGGDGYSIRGSRSSETQIRLDGLNMGDQFTGGFGGSGSRYFPMVSAYATEEVQVITGNFAAQYGDAQGGIVNSVMKTGRTDRFEGHLSFKSDLGFLSGSQSTGTKVVEEGGKFKLVDGGEGAKLLVGNNKSIDIGIGGPVSFLNDKTTFYLSVINMITPDGSGYDIKDPLGNSTARSPVSGTWMKNFEGRLAFGITNDIKLVIGGKYGLTSGQSTSFTYDTAVATPYINPATGQVDPVNGIATSNGVTATYGKAGAFNQFVRNVFARLNHTLTDRSFYELTFSWGVNNQESGRKVSGTELNYFKGFEIMEPVDNWVVDASKWMPAIMSADGRLVGDKVIDWASPITYIGYSKDKYCTSSWNGVNPLTGYYEGESYGSGTNNPWGIQGKALSGGTQGFSYRYGNFIQGDGNYNLFGLTTGDFKHTIKAGFEATYYTMNRHYNGSPYSGSPSYDIFTDMWGGNIYAENNVVYNKTSKPINQFKLGAYIQDQITFKGIVINPGFRLDVMNPMSKYRVISADRPQFIPISSDVEGDFKDATVKFKISPRININYPITESSYISMSYGQFFQSPAASYLYDGFNLDKLLSSSSVVGDPNMEAQQTNQYQVSYQNQITPEVALSLTAYYKDIYNQLGITHIMTAPDAYMQYAVSEYGTSKGIEVSVDKYLSDYFGFQLNYALAYLTVTSSEVGDNASVLLDPYSHKLAFPLAPFFSSSDIRHIVKGNLYFQVSKNEGPTVFGMQPLQNMVVSIGPYWRSGAPYTKTSSDGSMYISEKNVYRTPSAWNVDMSISKAFYLKDWFGDGMKNSMIEFRVEISNVFNRRAALSVYSSTDDPLDNGRGLNYTLLGHFNAIPWYKTATHANPASYTTEQYDIYGNRLYNEIADVDQNGIVTQEEKYAAWRKDYETRSIQYRGNFQSPITVRAGVLFRF